MTSLTHEQFKALFVAPKIDWCETMWNAVYDCDLDFIKDIKEKGESYGVEFDWFAYLRWALDSEHKKMIVYFLKLAYLDYIDWDWVSDFYMDTEDLDADIKFFLQKLLYLYDKELDGDPEWCDTIKNFEEN